MTQNNSDKLLYFLYWCTVKNKTGRSSEQQEGLGILSTDKENNYLKYIKLINDYTGATLKKNIKSFCELSPKAILNTDGEKEFNTLNQQIKVNNEK